MNRSKQGIVLAVETDPFQNMIMRPNKSPVLKPVVVSSRSQLQVSRSAGSLREKFKLPPLSTSRKTQNFVLPFDRANIHTPHFKITSKISEGRSQQTKHKHKPPVAEIFHRNKKPNHIENDFIAFPGDVSFGDVEENVGGLNERMRKYKY